MTIRSVFLATLVGVAQLTRQTLGQSTISSQPVNVPTGTPIVGDYNGAYRPQLHYSPPQHFMNDPNGMFRGADGVWHLYYQYNPTGVVAGNQHWGHATSKDLYHWSNQPIALFPPEKDVFMYSGSAVVDVNNTSGFFPGQDNGVVAIYVRLPYTKQALDITVANVTRPWHRRHCRLRALLILEMEGIPSPRTQTIPSSIVHRPSSAIPKSSVTTTRGSWWLPIHMTLPSVFSRLPT